jgi:hypothetical protein
MTCAHVLGLIDAGLAGHPRGHDAAARRHALTCDACARAIAAAGQVRAGLTEWPEVAPPPDLAAVVMARIARAEEARQGDSPAVGRGAVAVWAPGATVLGGLAACVALSLSAAAGGMALIRVVGTGLGGSEGGGASWPATLPQGVLLAVGLALYAVGLFAPVGRQPSR